MSGARRRALFLGAATALALAAGVACSTFATDEPAVTPDAGGGDGATGGAAVDGGSLVDGAAGCVDVPIEIPLVGDTSLTDCIAERTRGGDPLVPLDEEVVLRFAAASALPPDVVRLDLTFTVTGGENDAHLAIHVLRPDWAPGGEDGGADRCRRLPGFPGVGWGDGGTPSSTTTFADGVDYVSATVFEWNVLGTLEGDHVLPIDSADVLAQRTAKGWDGLDFAFLILQTSTSSGRSVYMSESGAAKAPKLVAHTCPAPL